ncbi:hypothetical protein OPW41_17060 [Vibrio europaeus]|uniref:Phage protein n=1 Tax=Vibrio europaeus TaxID=300876 RepID=A0A178JFB1_9VIBR|nr:hypothetical protein [Vibrio europaeus]MDC5707618.1 hypothetical protein [Vibrio europaeus]MDC5709864.1 hypothetical protein [Vibrio europaeus]MDC5716659.1 hypothetical protein [Vibrio europaeus]MDC5722720.1 hypothetical protein [Vibrio europaeus]MDC5726979.1 hypothetical protein [Vibrio europaeus]
MANYDCWVFYSEHYKLFFITTHTQFADMTTKAIKQGVATGWDRTGLQREQIQAIGNAQDFSIETTTVTSTADMQAIKAKYIAKGYTCANRKIQLTKNNRNVD